MGASKNPEDDDPVLAAELERALAPYKSLVPAGMLEVYRDILRNALTEHPVGKALVDRVRQLERQPPSKSGEETKEGVVVAGPETKAPSTGGKPGGQR